jgi:hypothetical protein
MPYQSEIKRLLFNLNVSANDGSTYGAIESTELDIPRTPKELLNIHGNLDPYKRNQAWPGRKYLLIGNSFRVDNKIIATTDATKRTACIAVVLERGRNNRRCVSVEDAFANPGFVEALSRFEFDWLRRQPPSTLIGPAFDEDGNLIPEAFSVWQRQVEDSEAGLRKEQKVLLSR